MWTSAFAPMLAGTLGLIDAHTARRIITAAVSHQSAPHPPPALEPTQQVTTRATRRTSSIKIPARRASTHRVRIPRPSQGASSSWVDWNACILMQLQWPGQGRAGQASVGMSLTKRRFICLVVFNSNQSNHQIIFNTEALQ